MELPTSVFLAWGFIGRDPVCKLGQSAETAQALLLERVLRCNSLTRFRFGGIVEYKRNA